MCVLFHTHLNLQYCPISFNNYQTQHDNWFLRRHSPNHINPAVCKRRNNPSLGGYVFYYHIRKKQRCIVPVRSPGQYGLTVSPAQEVIVSAEAVGFAGVNRGARIGR